jgi:hypothetical protein
MEALKIRLLFVFMLIVPLKRRLHIILSPRCILEPQILIAIVRAVAMSDYNLQRT